MFGRLLLLFFFTRVVIIKNGLHAVFVVILFNCCNKIRDNSSHLKSCNPTMMMEELGVYAQVGGQIDIMELLITT